MQAVHQEGSEEMGKVKWEPRAVKEEKKEAAGQGHLEVNVFRENGKKYPPNGMRKKL